nr:hypothetical protein [Tanacetum cinerariifolium]
MFGPSPEVMKGLSECKASQSNHRRIQVKDIVKKVEDYLKTYSLAGIDISRAVLIYKTFLETVLSFKQIKIQSCMELYHLSHHILVQVLAIQDSNSDVEDDQRTNNELMADLNAEYHERSLLANKKIFYKRSGMVGSTRKPIDKTKETCFACEKTGHFQKDCPSNKTSTPSYLSLNNSFNKFKSYTPPINQTSSHNTGNYQKDYKGKYKGLKAEMVVLTQRIDDLTKGNKDEGTIRIKAFMTIAKDEPFVKKADARVIEKWTCSKVTLDQLFSEQIPGNIVKALGGKGRRKENNPSKEVLFTKADVSTFESAPIITSDSEDD